jgi:acetylglutamate kinase
MQKEIAKAKVLIEALPYIREFNEKTVVIKYGGHAMVDEQLKEDFARDITLLKLIGLHPVVVHGGGPQISLVLERMGIRSTFVQGMRVTDAPTMDVVEMVLGGSVNKAIVAQINRQGDKAVGLSGKDAGLIQARKLKIVHHPDANKPPEIIDAGLVGDVTDIDVHILTTLNGEGFIPIVAPVGTGSRGETFNINADVVASRIAMALGAGRLVFLTDVDGVLDTAGKLVSSIDAAGIARMIDSGEISGGMIPKIRHAINAVEKGVGKVAIINGTRRHALLLELFTDSGIGTEVTP